MVKKFDYGFVIPLKEEAKPLLARINDKKEFIFGSRKIIIGNLEDYRVSLIISGCGKIKVSSATQLLIDKYPAKLLIHYGTAGAISPKLKIGEIIVATQVIEHDVRVLFPKELPPPCYKINPVIVKKLRKFSGAGLIFGPIISGDQDVVTSNRKDKLLAKYGGLAVDWESAGFALTCQLNSVPSMILRVISDYADENTSQEYEANQKAVIKILTETLSKILKIIERGSSGKKKNSF